MASSGLGARGLRCSPAVEEQPLRLLKHRLQGKKKAPQRGLWLIRWVGSAVRSLALCRACAFSFVSAQVSRKKNSPGHVLNLFFRKLILQQL